MSSKKMKLSTTKRNQQLLSRIADQYKQLKKQVQKIGYVMTGSIVRRTKQCGQPGCHCHRGPKYEHGPYYQWTRKVRGKTVTKILPPDQARLYRQWIQNGRRLRRIVTRMHATSTRLARLVREGNDK